jgi:predicted glutamine amidotransferase
MCRWLAYSGQPIQIEDLIFKPEHSLIDQSLSAVDSDTTTNGDGFGVGWYDEYELPGLYKHIQPAWNDPNLRDLCAHVVSPMFLAHVRAATYPLSIQQTNCHPFRYGRWLFMHNGSIREFPRVKRDLAMAVSDHLYPEIKGSTDSEIMFYLALTFGMEDDVMDGIARMVGFVEEVGFSKGIQHPIRMTLGIADGEKIYGVRYSSEHSSQTLFHLRSIATLREVAPPELRDRLERYSDIDRAIVSEPLTELLGPWKEVPESMFLTVENGEVHHEPFRPLKT